MQIKKVICFKIFGKITLFLLFLSLFNSLISFSQEIKVNKFEYNDSSKTPLLYSLNVQYPQIEGVQDKGMIDTINNTIKSYWQNDLDSYINKIDNMALLKPGKDKNSWCEIYYQVFSTKDIFSFAFFTYKLYPDLNIPISSVKTFNFDLTTGNQLAFDDLFQNNSDYLTALSINSREYLKAEIDEDPDEALYDYNSVIEGTKPVAENFQNFNISQSSLIIIFELYHFGAKSDRFVQAEIPWDKIKNMMK